MDLSALQTRRLRTWRQTPNCRITGPEDAKLLIDKLGIVTLYPASPEVPNLFHSYMGDPDARTDSGHDSPSGQVYGWRWSLGKTNAAFYSAIVRDRPTWVSWDLLPAMLRLKGEIRLPEALYESGEISGDALRVANALAEADGVLSTGELRARAGFPTGKLQRAAYLRAVQELDTRLLLAKVFGKDQGDYDMRHGLVAMLYPEHVRVAAELSLEEAAVRVMRVYLSGAAYAVPAVLARHLKVTEQVLREGLDHLCDEAHAHRMEIQGIKNPVYLWGGE